VQWLIINLLAFVGTPVGLAWAWILWAKRRRDQRGVRTTMSFLGISATTLSLPILFCARFFPHVSRALDGVGLSVAVAGALISLAGQLRIAVPVWLASIGTVMLWYGLTLP